MAAQNVVELVLKAIDQASGTLRQVGDEVRRFSGATGAAGEEAAKAGDKAAKSGGQIEEMGRAAQKSGFEMWNLDMVATAAFGAVAMTMEKAVKVQQDYKNALLGLSSVAAGFQQDTEQAKQAAKDLAADGLMTVADAATSLKNLLAAKFSLPEAVAIIERFKDSAAFGRQASLSFGEAVRSATEGIKNGNSILVDNAGVTKNLSIMLEEAGFKAQDLMRASEDAGVRQAIFNGIMRETQHQVGDAARLAATLSGEMSRASVSVKEVGIQIGDALEPALRGALSAVTPILGKLAEWIRNNPQLASSIGLVTVALAGMGAAAAAMATFVIPALSAAVGFLATPVGMAALAISTLTAMILASSAAAAGAGTATQELVKARQAEVAATQSQISALQRAGEEYASLKEQIESGRLTAEQEQKAKADLIIVEQRLQSELGKEGLARIKSAEDTRTAVNAEMASLQEKLRVQKEALQKTLLMENEQTLKKIEATQDRIAAIEKEAQAYSIWGRVQEVGIKTRISTEGLGVKLYDWLSKVIPGELGEAYARAAEAARERVQAAQGELDELYSQERSAEVSRLVGELTNLRQSLHDVNIDTGVNTDASIGAAGASTRAAGAAEKHAGAVSRLSEALSEQEFELQKLEKRWAAYEAGLSDTDKGIAFLASKKEYLAAKIDLLNGVIEETAARLEEATAAEERDEAEVQKLTLKILDLQANQAGLRKQVAETTAEMERQVMALVQHEAAMRRLSAEQQIEALRRLRSAHEENSREIWQVDEQLAGLYRDRIQEALKDVERAYQDQLAAIDAAAESATARLRRQMEVLDQETKETVEDLQRQLDQMDEQDRLRDREKAREEHEKRVKELLEQRHYHEIRSGKEHKKAIEEIDKQLAEEEQRWTEEQARWEEEDRRRQIQEQIDHVQEQANIQREALQDQIDQIQESAAKQRKALQDHYAKVTKLTEEGIWDSIAAMAATEPQWFETGKKLIDALVAGIKSGQPEMSAEAAALVGQVQAGASAGRSQGGSAVNESLEQPISVIPRSQYEEINDRAVMWSRRLAEMLGLGNTVEWDDAAQRVRIGGQWFTPLKVEDGRSYVSVRQVAEALGHRVEYDGFSGTIRIYHAGGLVDRTGPAILEEGEYVLPRRVVEAVRGGSASPGLDLTTAIREAADRIIAAVEALRPGLVVQGPLVQNDQVILPAGAGDWFSRLTEGAEAWIRGGKV